MKNIETSHFNDGWLIREITIWVNSYPKTEHFDTKIFEQRDISNVTTNSGLPYCISQWITEQLKQTWAFNLTQIDLTVITMFGDHHALKVNAYRSRLSTVC